MQKIKYIVLLASIGFLFAAANLPQPDPEENTAVIPTPREGRAYERFLMLNERVRKNQGNVDLLFVGDSITERWEKNGKDVWNEFYGHRKALNIGISADRTQHVLWRLDHGNIEGISPKVTVLLIGTNNSGLDRNTTSETLEGVYAVVEKLQTELPDTKILLLGIFPRGKEFNEQRGKITQVNQILQKMDEREGIHYLNIGHVFLESDGSISEEIMPDALHLSPEGYRLWAEAMEPHLKELLN